MKKVCNNCKIFVKGEKCLLCNGNDFSDNWKGRIFIFDAENSEVAKKLEIKAKGEYAIKTR